MFWFTVVLTIVNFFFLVLGLLLTVYAKKHHIEATRDTLFPVIANEYLGTGVALFFILGLIAAAYSSADSSLTALTTSFSIDILEIEKRYEAKKQEMIRKRIHLMFVGLSILVILLFKYVINDSSIIDKVFKFAGFTYGPLLGLYSYGLFTRWSTNDRWVPFLAIFSVVSSIVLNLYSRAWFGFEFGFEILIVNGLIMFCGLGLLGIFLKK